MSHLKRVFACKRGVWESKVARLQDTGRHASAHDVSQTGSIALGRRTTQKKKFLAEWEHMRTVQFFGRRQS
jgi:hypothetical protein